MEIDIKRRRKNWTQREIVWEKWKNEWERNKSEKEKIKCEFDGIGERERENCN